MGEPIPGAVLRLDSGGACLYLDPPDPNAQLWHGPLPTLAERSEELELEVRPLRELTRDPEALTLPLVDPGSRAWLASLMGRTIATEPAPEDEELARLIIAQRLCHDEAAIAQIRQALATTAEAHIAAMHASRPGRYEAEVRAAMDERIVARGMTHAYAPIVTVTGEVLHDLRHDRQLEPRSLVLADVGAETPEGWAADITRTWPASGKFSAAAREIYQVVLEMQRAGLAEIRPGTEFRQVHHAARRTLVAGLLELGILRGDPDELHRRGASALFFPHGVGHLLGLDVHDMEALGDRAGYLPDRERSQDPADRFLRLDRPLAAGMVVTVEPGFYRVENLCRCDPSLRELVDRDVLARYDDVRGIRIEDDVLITPTGHEVLSAAIPKEPEQIEAIVQGASAAVSSGDGATLTR